MCKIYPAASILAQNNSKVIIQSLLHTHGGTVFLYKQTLVSRSVPRLLSEGLSARQWWRRVLSSRSLGVRQADSGYTLQIYACHQLSEPDVPGLCNLDTTE